MSAKSNSLDLTDDGGLVRMRERMPMLWTNLEDLLVGIRKVVTENRGLRKITFEAGKPYVLIEKDVPVGEARVVGEVVDYHTAIRAKPMEEWEPAEMPNKKGAHQQLYEMFKQVSDNEYQVSHVVVTGPTSYIYTWLHLTRKTQMVLGVPLVFAKQIPDDVIVVCGSDSRDARPEDIEFSVKGTMS